MDWEFTLLRDTSRSIAEVASLTGRTSGACRRKADLLGLGPRVLPSAAGRVRSRFSATEDDLILELWDDLSITDLAVFLGRSPAAVGKRIHRLGLRDGFPVGPEHWNWKDGASQNASYGWRGPDWPEVRAQVMDRDGFTCQDGGEFIPSGSGLVVHHVIPWRLRQVNDPQWLVTLCTSHHMQRPEHKWRDLPPEVEEQLKLFRLAS